MAWPDAALTLYHGTTLDAAQDILRHGINPDLLAYGTDFGPGLYTTTRRHVAERWACIRAGSRQQPALLIWETSYKDLGRLHVCAFGDGGQSAADFWDYIRFNREDKQPHLGDSWFELSIGPMATRYQGQRVLLPAALQPWPVLIRREVWIQRLDVDQYCFHPSRGIEFLDKLKPALANVLRAE